MKQIKQNEKGFTLVELVVVIAILVVLAALMVPRIIGSIEDAKRSSDIGDARTIASEVVTHNAQEKAKDSSTKIIGTGRYHKEHVVPHLDFTSDDMPDKNYAEIVVDSNGEVSVDIKAKS